MLLTFKLLGGKMIRKLFLFTILILFMFVGCATAPMESAPVQPVKADVTITIVQEGDAVAVKVTTPDEINKIIHKSMEVDNPGLQLSPMSAISGGRLFVKIFSGLSVVDVTRFWNDLIYLENETYIRDVVLFIDSPGGDAFSGLALADQIEKYQKKGFRFSAHATGIVASAAVPVFAVCDETYATSATIFMVHEAAIWKWPGRETASDIRTQNKMMDLLQKLYLKKLVRNSNKTFDEWVIMEKMTSWFSVEDAKSLGMLDHIE
jgi:ATP-dependent protease ClpP protease subunit